VSHPHDAGFSQRLIGRHRIGLAFAWLCAAATWMSLVFLAVLLGALVWQSRGWLTWDFLWKINSGTPEKAGIYFGLLGSLWLIGLTAVFCVPVGVGAAIYLEEYARPSRMTRFIQLNISNLAGVPSIVYGILGFTVFVRMFNTTPELYNLWLGGPRIQFYFPPFNPLGPTVISGSLTLTLLSLPVVIIAAQEALRSVPPTLRHASYALGATKWQTIRQQVLPAALPGILTGVILALSRALGETAPLAVLGVATYITYAPGRISSVSDLVQRPTGLLRAPFDEFTAIPLQIYSWVDEANPKFQSVAAAGIVVLLVVLVLMNGAAIYIRQHFQRRIRW
jgi:phosphate transport system permease protein